MALEGTHIRFALDLKDNLQIKNLDKYLSGTIYPDSRYVTKIDRNITHFENPLNKNFYKNDDFKKGWVIHLLCDQIQTDVFGQTFATKFPPKNTLGSWVFKTSLKILQDIYDVKQFPIKKYLKHLDYIETINGEDPKILKSYNQIFIDIYQNDTLSIDNTIDMWTKLGIDEVTTLQIRKTIDQMNLDPTIIQEIPLLYPKMVKEGLKSKYQIL